MGRYRSRKNGKAVSLANVIKDLTKYRESIEFDKTSSYSYVKNKLTEASVTNYLVGRGGLLLANKKELKALSKAIDDQLSIVGDYSLKLLFRSYKKGDISSEMFEYRLRQFLKSSKTQFWRGTVEANKNKTHYKRVLGATDMNCPECLSMASKGWQLISNGVILPTQKCSCLNNCRCKLVFK